MPLEHELLELNGAYQSALSANSALRDRNKQLEALVKEYQELVGDYLENSFFHAFPEDMEALQQRAKELLD